MLSVDFDKGCLGLGVGGGGWEGGGRGVGGGVGWGGGGSPGAGGGAELIGEQENSLRTRSATRSVQESCRKSAFLLSCFLKSDPVWEL